MATKRSIDRELTAAGRKDANREVWVVTGGRYIDPELSEEFVVAHLEALVGEHGEPGLVVIGGGRGYDPIVQRFFEQLLVHVAVIRPLWNHPKGKSSAIRLRNTAMFATIPNRVIAFPGADVTRGVLKKARNRGIEIHSVSLLKHNPFARRQRDEDEDE